MAERLQGKRVAILATDGFEQSELLEPRKILDEAGATTTVVSPKAGEIKGWNEENWGQSVAVDRTLDGCSADDFDALVLPGGQMNPDKLRLEPAAVAFVKAFMEAGKPVGAICHGPWLLVEANVVRGRKVTSWPSISTDLKNAGAEWVDQEVVVDKGLVTSRKPDDIPAFGRKLVEEIGEGVHAAGARKTAASLQ
ncbi:MAG: type 1 glutamine amidotransferase domain-containing protein [Fimbriimonas sp.]